MISRVFVVSVAVFICAVGAVTYFFMGPYYLPSETEYIYDQFVSSDYLQSLWSKTCVYPLKRKNLILIATIVEEENQVDLNCYWHQEPVGITSGVGIVLQHEQTDIDTRWFGCNGGKPPDFVVRSAVHYPGSNLVHLNEGLQRKKEGTSHILVAECHYWDENYCNGSNNRYCQMENASSIKSVAYAVFDEENGEIHW